MDAVKFLQERNRMYESGAATPGIGLEDDYDPVIAVKIVEEWSAAHPRKTRQSVFMEQWPNAKVFVDGVLDFCPQELDSHYPCQSTDVEMRCQSCRRKFWMQEVE
jgi:hypothetical protein